MNEMVDILEVGRAYARQELVPLWRLGGFQAISRGVFTPAGRKLIFLFVTRFKQEGFTPYKDFIEGSVLLWEGEKLHGSDERIAKASLNGDSIHLFYRERHHSPFIYHGKIVLTYWQQQSEKPSEFIFKIASMASPLEYEEKHSRLAEEAADYRVASAAALNSIDRRILTKSRGIAQDVFRGNLLKLWDGSCAVTGVRETRILRSSHIKPWSKATVAEKVDHFNGLLLIPNLDTLFNDGFITFQSDGAVSISNKWDRADQQRMHIESNLHLLKVIPESQAYLEYHRDVVFRS